MNYVTDILKAMRDLDGSVRVSTVCGDLTIGQLREIITDAMICQYAILEDNAQLEQWKADDVRRHYFYEWLKSTKPMKGKELGILRKTASRLISDKPTTLHVAPGEKPLLHDRVIARLEKLLDQQKRGGKHMPNDEQIDKLIDQIITDEITNANKPMSKFEDLKQMYQFELSMRGMRLNTAEDVSKYTSASATFYGQFDQLTKDDFVKVLGVYMSPAARDLPFTRENLLILAKVETR